MVFSWPGIGYNVSFLTFSLSVLCYGGEGRSQWLSVLLVLSVDCGLDRICWAKGRVWLGCYFLSLYSLVELKCVGLVVAI